MSQLEFEKVTLPVQPDCGQLRLALRGLDRASHESLSLAWLPDNTDGRRDKIVEYLDAAALNSQLGFEPQNPNEKVTGSSHIADAKAAFYKAYGCDPENPDENPGLQQAWQQFMIQFAGNHHQEERGSYNSQLSGLLQTHEEPGLMAEQDDIWQDVT